MQGFQLFDHLVGARIEVLGQLPLREIGELPERLPPIKPKHRLDEQVVFFIGHLKVVYPLLAGVENKPRRMVKALIQIDKALFLQLLNGLVNLCRREIEVCAELVDVKVIAFQGAAAHGYFEVVSHCLVHLADVLRAGVAFF